jgi:tetraacyldisaccharide 4'-kinase
VRNLSSHPKNARWLHRAWERKRLFGKIAWILLLPFSCVFSIVVFIRNLLFSMHWRRALALERPVISIGNLTVGGTGKTPSCLWLAQELESRGLRVAVLSRGYKRNAVRPVILCPDSDGYLPSEGDVATAGDEPFMMARLYGQTVGVGKERYRVAQELLGKSEVDVFILDDGFQHRQLKRDVDLVLLGNDSAGSLLPAGPFREPRNALRRADFVLLTGARENWKPVIDSVANGACFAGSLEAVALVGFESNLWKEHPLTLLYRSRILAVTGVANPEGLYRFIRDYEGEIVDILEFPDHHGFSSSDWQQINRAARGVDLIVTTEKDIVKLVRFPFAREKLLALRVAMKVENGGVLVQAILDRIQKKIPRTEPALQAP